MTLPADLAIVGGGPAGLAAAIQARRRGAGRVIVLEREREAGGIPRHSDHLGYGIRDLHRLMSGPRYARALTDRAIGVGAEILTETSVTEWIDDRTLRFTSPRGLEEVTADAVILATGCRERPRTARLVPGTRPAGVLTTGSLQGLVAAGRPIGRRAVIVGAEHVSFSAILMLHHAGTSPSALVTDLPRDQTYRLLKLVTSTRLRVPILTNALVTRIVGRERVEAVEVTDAHGGIQTIRCDTVVFTGDWIPDSELARLGHLDIDPGTRGPRIDTLQRTSRLGVFAAGNLVHAALTADTASRCGRMAADAAARFLVEGHWHRAPVPIEVQPPIRWISPGAVANVSDVPPHRGFVVRVDRFARNTTLAIRQDDRELWTGRYRRLVPARPFRAPASWVRRIDLDGPAVRLSLD